MLPFLKSKDKHQSAGLIVADRNPESDAKDIEEALPPAVLAAASDIMVAMHSKDIKHLALALKSLFDIMESLPHREGPHIEE